MLKRYLYLLKLTLIEAMVIAKDYDNPIQILFSCRILALATFRIPSFGDIVMSALLDLQPPLHLSLPDIRFDVLNNVMSDDCFSCTLSESETVSDETSSVTRSYSYSYGPSTLAVSTEVGVSAEVGVSLDVGVTTDSETDTSSFSDEYYSSEYENDSKSVGEEENEPPLMLFPFEESTLSNHEDSTESNNGDPLLRCRPLDSIRNQQDALPSDLKLTPSIHESDLTPDTSPLLVIDYTVRVEQLCESSLHSHTSYQHTQFASNYPSLLYWCVLPDPGVNAGTRASWYDCFLYHPVLTLSFIRCWCDLCHLYQYDVQKRPFLLSYSFIAMLYEAIPGYFLILRLFLPILQSLILHQYHCGLTRSHAAMDNAEYVVAVLKASESMLMFSSHNVMLSS